MRIRKLQTFVVALLIVGWALAGPAADAAIFNGTAGNDYLGGTNREDRMSGFAGSDNLWGQGSADKILGGSGFDYLWGGGGRDKVFTEADGGQIVDDDGKTKPGEKGDKLVGGPATDYIYSADGEKDKINCGGGTDYVFADANDNVDASCENVFRTSLAGLTFGNNRSNTLNGTTSGPEQIYGKGGNDIINGGEGVDAILGGKGADTLNGGNHNDSLWDDDTKPGDKLYGDAGDDGLVAADGKPGIVDCGPGNADIAFVDPSDTVTNCETVVPI